MNEGAFGAILGARRAILKFLWLSDNARIYALGVQRVNEVIRPVGGGGGGGGGKFWASI